MFMKHWKKDLFAIPNLLSLLRIALIPVYMILYRRGDHGTAGLVLALSCLTDMMDGYIARRFSMTTALGAILDPIADKATQLTLIVCLSMRYRVLRPVLVLFIIKESVQLVVSLFCLRRGKTLCGALWTGKVCTAILFIGFIILVIFPRLPSRLVAAIALTDALALGISFACYALTFLGKRKDRHLHNLEE